MPPLEEQKRIAEILWAADEAVESYLNAKKQLQITMFSTFQHLIATSDTIINKISDIGKVITGSTPATKNSAFYEKHEFMFVSPADIRDDKFVNHTDKMVSTLGVQSGREIPRNAIMVVCIGSTTGKVAMSSERCITNQQINSVICNELVNPDFFYWQVKQMGSHFYRQASCTAIPILNKSQFSKIEVPLPSLDVQKSIVQKLRYLENASDNLDKHLISTRIMMNQIREKWM